MKISLAHPFPSVSNRGCRSYGGNQTWSDSKTMQECGCGVIACQDLLIYLLRYHHAGRAGRLQELLRTDPIPLELYDKSARSLSRRFLPLIPRHGINGLLLAGGLNLFFLREGLAYRAVWGVKKARFWPCIEDMLLDDIPVILSIGPNLPLFWQSKQLSLYTLDANGGYRPAVRTHAHYVSVTGIDDTWLHISSWGREYYINREEYRAYIAAHSSSLVSNILWVRPTHRAAPPSL